MGLVDGCKTTQVPSKQRTTANHFDDEQGATTTGSRHDELELKF
jgi:hypothetical protein